MKHKTQIIIWIILTIIISIIFYTNKEYFLNDFWLDIEENYLLVVLFYILLSLIRAFFLLPVTPFLLVWVVFLNTIDFFIISVAWIMIGALFIYYFSSYFWFDKYFSDTKYQKNIELSKKYLSWKYGFFIFASWTVIPVVPNVLISYVWWALKVPMKIFFFWTLTWAILETLTYIIFKDVIVGGI